MARRYGQRAVLGFVAGEGRQRKRIGREQAVTARVPAHRVTRVIGVVQDRYSHLFAVHCSGVVAPVGRLAPELAFARQAVGISDVSGASGFLEHRPHANAEGAILGVAEGHGVGRRSESDVEIDDTQLRIGIEGHPPRFGQQLVAGQVGPVESGGDHAPVLPATHPVQLGEDDFAAIGRGVGGFVIPEIETVDLLVREPQAALMRVVGLGDGRLFFNFFHRPHPRHISGGGRAQRMEKRLGDTQAGDEECRKKLAVDDDVDRRRIAGMNLHLDAGRLRPRIGLDLRGRRPDEGRGGKEKQNSVAHPIILLASSGLGRRKKSPASGRWQVETCPTLPHTSKRIPCARGNWPDQLMVLV